MMDDDDINDDATHKAWLLYYTSLMSDIDLLLDCICRQDMLPDSKIEIMWIQEQRISNAIHHRDYRIVRIEMTQRVAFIDECRERQMGKFNYANRKLLLMIKQQLRQA